MSEVERERIKYFATLLNTCAAASFTISVIGPSAAAVYGASPRVPLLLFLVIAAGWLSVPASLHLSVRFILGRLR